MALEIDGFAVFHSIGSHRSAFAGIATDLAKAAQTLVVKAIKDKKTGVVALRDIRWHRSVQPDHRRNVGRTG
ncbi:MAG TPA: hypothetical protein VFY53_13495 [Rhodoplanes sp.]|nr:hypothetical protein [Rhodoplanes sp.]